MKKTVLFLMVILLTIGACGCSMSGQREIEAMVSYINEKYTDDTFEYVSMSGGHLGSNTTKIIVKSEKYPDKEIRVICSEVDGNKCYSDTYLNVKFEEETRAYIEKAMSKAFGDKVYVRYIPDDTGSMKKGTSETQFSDFISDSTTYVYFNAVVVLENVDREEKQNKIKDAFVDGVVLCDIYFVDTSYIDQFNTDPMALVENKQYYESLCFIKSSVDQYKWIEWEDGGNNF